MERNTRLHAIKEAASAMQLPYLLHFTQAANLPTIFAHGIYPLARMQEIGVQPLVNDHLRLDGQLGCSSVSIGFPNSKMFFKYRKTNTGADWVVLLLHPGILWSKRSAFCQHNAADHRVRSQTLASRMSLQAFQGMFAEIEGIASRRDQKLLPSDPTDVQAEVLVLDVIEPQFIMGAIFNSPAVRDRYMSPVQAVASYIHRDGKGMYADRRCTRNLAA